MSALFCRIRVPNTYEALQRGSKGDDLRDMIYYHAPGSQRKDPNVEGQMPFSVLGLNNSGSKPVRGWVVSLQEFRVQGFRGKSGIRRISALKGRVWVERCSL